MTILIRQYLIYFFIHFTDSIYLSEKLRFARVLINSNEACTSAIQPIPSMNEPTLLCAVATNDMPHSGTACHGDTGGALIIYENNVWTQIALAQSFPLGCKANVPTVYARLGYALDWISNVSGTPIINQ